ncbi:MAG: DMT family transporter [Pseudomonadota bacterium]
MALSKDNPAATPAPSQFRMSSGDIALYAVLVFAWSASWYPLKLQIGVVDPEVSLVWRFIIAGLVMFALLAATGRPLLVAPRHHPRLALIGILMFSSNFFLFYNAAFYVPSGLLTVIFSTTSIMNLALGMLLLGLKPDLRVGFGALLGVIGIACVFSPELSRLSFGDGALIALLLGLSGTLSFALGNTVSSTLKGHEIPIFTSVAWCMIYGALFMALIATVRGSPFIVDWRLPYIGSLIWLTLTSSVLALAVYTTLISRIGAARTGYATVIFPVFALLISTVLEGYQWHMWSMVGVPLVVLGNYFVLSGGGR